MISLVVKSPLATRKCDLVGRKRDIEELVFVSADKILVKIKTAIDKEESRLRWAMLDSNGKVLPLPAELNRINAYESDEDQWFAVSSG